MCRSLSLSVTVVLILEKQNETVCLGVAKEPWPLANGKNSALGQKPA